MKSISSHGALILGTLAARGQQSVAEACAKHLKEFIEHSNGGRLTAQTGGASRQASALRSTVAISSTPAGAEIYLDEQFVGSTPSSLDVAAGTHSISVKKPGFQDWAREMSFQGGAITLSAELVPGSAGGPQPVRLSQRSASVVVGTPPGWIGVAAEPATSDGAVVTAVFPDGPGAKAGLKVGDIIQSVNGTTLKDDFETAIGTYKPGTNIVVSFMRGAWGSVKLVTVGQSPL